MGTGIPSNSTNLKDQRKYLRAQAKVTQDTTQRLENLETTESHNIIMAHLSSLFLNGVTLTAGVDYSPPISPAAALDVSNIQGVIANFWIDPSGADRNIYFGSSDDTLDTASQRYRYLGGADTDRQVMSQLMMIPVGTDGNIKIQSVGGNSTAYMTIIGYWI